MAFNLAHFTDYLGRFGWFVGIGLLIKDLAVFKEGLVSYELNNHF